MAFVTYEDVRPWARSIKNRVERPHTDPERMPPWYIDKNIGIQEFKDDPSLSEEDIALIVDWVDSGVPRGDAADMPAPIEWPAADVWTIGEPDHIVTSPVFTVRAQAPDWWGTLGPFPSGLTEDRYVKAVEVKEVWAPGTRERVDKAQASGKLLSALSSAVVHHMVVADIPPDANAIPGAAGGSSALVIYELGQNALVYPDTVGRVLKANADLVLDTHLHSVGAEVPAQVQIGFTFHPEGFKPKYKNLAMTLIGNPKDDIDIPAGDDNVRLDAYYEMPQAAKLATFEPHMHASGVRMCLEVFYGGMNGRRETLNCAGYNHSWVKVYTYGDDAAPLLPKGTVLHLTGWYNNSASNPNVIDPRNWKGYGRRSIDDMFILLPRVIYLTEEEFQAEVAEREAKGQLSQN